MPSLYKPIQIGRMNLKHRVILAPLTRMRAGPREVPTQLNAEYYEQRTSDGGFLISEACQINQQGQNLPHTPGCFTVEQLEGWKLTTEAVHKKNGYIYLQLWHTGRMSSPAFQVGSAPAVGPSAIGPPSEYSFRKDPLPAPRALTTEEVKDIVKQYRQCAINAIYAGFDGVELHGANGYLIDQFICDSSNVRTDEYGGSIENRCRFGVEAVNACCDAIGADRVGIRLSPFGALQTAGDSTPKATFTYLLEQLNPLDLAYVHLIEPRGFHRQSLIKEPKDVTKLFRRVYKGILLTASGYTRELGEQAVDEGITDGVVYGRLFISNPDLPFRLKNAYEINKYDRATFYGGTHVGYTDYPFHEQNKSKL